MNRWTLIARSLRYHWRTQLGVLLGAVVGTTVLTGALVVGDSVRYTLRHLALLRVGGTHLAMATQDRFFRVDLADELKDALGAPTAAVLQLRGSAVNRDNAARANRIQILGVDRRFWELAPEPDAAADLDLDLDGVILNARLADRLGVSVGSNILLRLERPSWLPRDAPLATVHDLSVTMPVRVEAIALDEQFGRFGLQLNQVSPLTAFVSQTSLQKRIDRIDRANLLLVGSPRNGTRLSVDAANAVVRQVWSLDDAQLQLHARPELNVVELRSPRVFLDPAVGAAARTLPGARGILTYFVNRLEHGQHTTPYSTVAAMEAAHFLNPDLADDQIVVNSWLAEDLDVDAGDKIVLTYFVMGPMQTLQELIKAFQVHSIVPIKGEAADRQLMPAFPGMADKEHCRDWRPGLPVNLDSIQEKDEAYWTRYRGTPKAFITLTAGQGIWENRFGNLTAVRFPLGEQSIDDFESALRDAIDPVSMGLFFLPVREQSLRASGQGQDFGQLFMAFSCFLIVGALLLMAMLFTFGVEQRGPQVATLLALGFERSHVRRLLLGEGLAIAIVGGLIGAGFGLLYTKGVLVGLGTVWQKAIGSAMLQFAAKPQTLVVGFLSGAAIAWLTIWLTMRRQLRRPVQELFAAGTTGSVRHVTRTSRARRATLWLTGGAVLAAIVLTIAGSRRDVPSPGLFFAAGAAVLTTGLGLVRIMLFLMTRVSRSAVPSVSALAVRGAARRPGRSLATVCLLACGCFMVMVVDAFRHRPQEGPQPIESGTGGFALVGESSLPVLHDLNREDGLDALGLNLDELGDISVLPFRVRDGDDASCLNLNRAQQPSLLGVDVSERNGEESRLVSRGAFRFVKSIDDSKGSRAWKLLEWAESDAAIPAIGDQATVFWALGLKVGDTLEYRDEAGDNFNLKIVAMTANTLLQGKLLIDERAFVDKFPNLSGYRMFLVDVPDEQHIERASRVLSRGLQDWGMEISTAEQRMAIYDEVENTYMSIFQALGSLGLILGSIGLGVVVLRNMMERRGELALLQAVGFGRPTVRWFVLAEHWMLLLIGVGCGVAAAAVAVVPALNQPWQQVPYTRVALTLMAVVASGALWAYLATATAAARSGKMVEGLRSE